MNRVLGCGLDSCDPGLRPAVDPCEPGNEFSDSTKSQQRLYELRG
jgi:hypothetical protein